MISDAEREKEARAARARLEEQRQEMLAQIEAKRWQMTLQMRRDLIKNFPDGNLPLSSQKVEADTLYFFSYTFDERQLAQPNPSLVVSNTFPVQRRGDGTWPYKNPMNGDLQKLSAGKNTLMGFHATRELADSVRNSFLNLANRSAVSVVPCNTPAGFPRTMAMHFRYFGDPSISGRPKPVGTKAAPPPPAKAPKDPNDFWK